MARANLTDQFQKRFVVWSHHSTTEVWEEEEHSMLLEAKAADSCHGVPKKTQSNLAKKKNDRKTLKPISLQKWVRSYSGVNYRLCAKQRWLGYNLIREGYYMACSVKG